MGMALASSAMSIGVSSSAVGAVDGIARLAAMVIAGLFLTGRSGRFAPSESRTPRQADGL